MSNSWLRLWHDMPNDPKWRTIARVSGQPISLVQAMYLHLLVDASRNVTRGHVSVTAEDLASALDVTEDAVHAVFDAMQGRVLDGGKLSGWDARQPKREDSGNSETGAKSAAQRKREQRAREKELAHPPDQSECHAASRNVTLDTDKDTDKEEIEKTSKKTAAAQPASLGIRDLMALDVEEQTAREFLALRRRKRAALTEIALTGIRREADRVGWTLDQALKKCIERGWQGFEASWVQGSKVTAFPTMNRQEALEARNREVAERLARTI